MLQEGYIRTLKNIMMVLFNAGLSLNTVSKEKIISGLRISKPGLRFVQKDEVPKVLNGLELAVISTSKVFYLIEKARFRREVSVTFSNKNTIVINYLENNKILDRL